MWPRTAVTPRIGTVAYTGPGLDVQALRAWVCSQKVNMNPAKHDLSFGWAIILRGLLPKVSKTCFSRAVSKRDAPTGQHNWEGEHLWGLLPSELLAGGPRSAATSGQTSRPRAFSIPILPSVWCPSCIASHYTSPPWLGMRLWWGHGGTTLPSPWARWGGCLCCLLVKLPSPAGLSDTAIMKIRWNSARFIWWN